MRDLVITQNITLDGVIDATEGWFAPSGESDVDESDHAEANRANFEAADAFVCGRVTFEEMRGYWPAQTDDETGVSDYLNRVQKYVVSSTIGDPEWEPTTVIDGDPVEALSALKREEGKDIVVTGSLQLMKALVPAGIVDEYRLFVYPVVVGRGQRLFEDAAGLGGLERVDVQPFRSGVTLMRYRAQSNSDAPQ